MSEKLDELTIDTKKLAEQLKFPEGEFGHELALEMNEANAMLSKMSFANLKCQPGDTLLEIGPGNAMLSRDAVDAIGESGQYIGIEHSQDMIEEAQANLKGLSCRNILFKTGDCLEITFEENEFADRIVAINVIYFIDDLDAFFKKIYSWQRKGGCISIGVRSKECLEKIPLTKNGFIIRSTEEIMGSMLAAGFRDIKIDQKIEGERRLSDQTFEVECLVLSGHK